MNECWLTQKFAFYKVSHSPHVDQVLSESNGVGIATDSDCTIGVAAFTFLAVRNANHGTRDLSNFSDFSTTFPDYAADQIVWHSHFMLLRVGLRPTLCRAQL